MSPYGKCNQRIVQDATHTSTERIEFFLNIFHEYAGRQYQSDTIDEQKMQVAR